MKQAGKKGGQGPILNMDMQRIINAQHDNPFCVLGRHAEGNGECVRAWLPATDSVRLVDIDAPMQRVEGTDFFEWHGDKGQLPLHYQLERQAAHGEPERFYDPYSFAPQLGELDLHLFAEGHHWHLWRVLGAQLHSVDNIKGVLFSVWAPNATRLSVVGDFNHWDGRRHPMRLRGESGVWELFIPGLGAGSVYKFELVSSVGESLFIKTDPYAKQLELRPGTAAIVSDMRTYHWQDAEWMQARANTDWLHSAESIYEVHLGSWRRDADGWFLNYRELAHQLVDYVKAAGFTHIELLPVSEHPFDGSWGYQVMGYYAPTSRFGSPNDFRYFVDYCHQHDIGVLLDWVPAHFPKDAHGLAWFDGSALYEHEDPRRGEHRDWDTLIFNYGRHEVRNFLLANANYWLDEFHIDGLRVDAVASMLYLDYSRKEGDWLPNKYGGRENIDAIEFLRELNMITHDLHPGTLIMAEESTDWPMVSRPTYIGGLGFTMKWNMGWMHDVLDYMKLDPVYRQYNHNKLSFGLMYAYNENFILPFSHDEVVHGKGSMRNKMPGDEWQQFAALRLVYTLQYTHPGKPLLFMGDEFGQGREWDHDQQLQWHELEHPKQSGLLHCVSDLNRLYREHPALHQYDFEPQGFEWIDCHDSQQSVISFIRKADNESVIVILNFTPVPRQGYRIGVPQSGQYTELFNSDSGYYAGSNLGNASDMHTTDIAWMARPYSLTLTLPPLGAIILKHI
jgi:1,4-alpha-glucan branching enzyme